MEQIIPILIAAVIFAFQTYANYQKEKEKASKRKMGRPVPDDTIPVEVPQNRPNKPVTRQAEYTPFEIPASPFDAYQGMLEADEVKKARQHRAAVARQGNNNKNNRSGLGKPSSLDKKVELTDLDDYDGGRNKSSSNQIDLREAVIHSVILERPNYF